MQETFISESSFEKLPCVTGNVSRQLLTPDSAKPISYYITNNTELILIRDAMDMLLPKLAKVVSNLARFAVAWKGEPCLAYTRLQPVLLFGISLLSLV